MLVVLLLLIINCYFSLEQKYSDNNDSLSSSVGIENDEDRPAKSKYLLMQYSVIDYSEFTTAFKGNFYIVRYFAVAIVFE